MLSRRRPTFSSPPGTILASSRTATPATPSPPWRTDTPCAGPTSLGSSCASADKSSSANHITQTWVSERRRVRHRPSAAGEGGGELGDHVAPGPSPNRGKHQSARKRERKGKALSDASRSKEMDSRGTLRIRQPFAAAGVKRVQRSLRGQDRNRISSH